MNSRLRRPPAFWWSYFHFFFFCCGIWPSREITALVPTPFAVGQSENQTCAPEAGPWLRFRGADKDTIGSKLPAADVTEAFFHSWRRCLLAPAQDGERSTLHRGRVTLGFFKLLKLIFYEHLHFTKKQHRRTSNLMTFSLLLIWFRLPFWHQRPLFNSECSSRRPNVSPLSMLKACCCHLLHCARTGAGMWHEVMSFVLYGQPFCFFCRTQVKFRLSGFVKPSWRTKIMENYLKLQPKRFLPMKKDSAPK